MEKKWVIVTLSLVSIVFISGCVGQNGGKIGEPKDEALKLEVRIKEKDEGRRILPDQTIKMLVYLKSQVEDEVKNVSFRISNPYGLKIKKVDCWFGCICEGTSKSSGCGEKVDCLPNYNGCRYDSIQSFDEVEISFYLKAPSEDEIPYPGTDLRPEIVLEYDYGGESTFYIPILTYEERRRDMTSEFVYTKQPIHVDIKSEDWVREGDIFPVYFEVRDVVTTRTSESRLTIPAKNFRVDFPDYVEINEDNIGRCDFNSTKITLDCHTLSETDCTKPCFPCEDQSTGDFVMCCNRGDVCHKIGLCEGGAPTTLSYYNTPKEDIELPLENPLVCTLRALKPPVPMVKTPIRVEYSYRYDVKRTESIRVEKALLRIF